MTSFSVDFYQFGLFSLSHTLALASLRLHGVFLFYRLQITVGWPFSCSLASVQYQRDSNIHYDTMKWALFFIGLKSIGCVAVNHFLSILILCSVSVSVSDCV